MYGETLLHQAAQNKNLYVVNLLLSNGADVNVEDATVDDGRWTPLHHACLSHNEQMLSLLLRKGADITLRDTYESDTPFLIIEPNGCCDDSLTIAMIKVIAKLKSIDDSFVSKSDIKLIQEFPELKVHFEKSNDELCKMKGSMFYHPYSYYCILEMSVSMNKTSESDEK